MKKLTILIAVLLLFSCEKPKDEPAVDPNKGTVTFWTTEESVEITRPQLWRVGWILWVDDIRIGVISKPYNVTSEDQAPNCYTKGFTKLVLMKGRHNYYMTLSEPQTQPPNYRVSQTYYFDVTARGCTVVRCIL
jgi:hypothetical protein